ncbi:YIP1 family protein [Halovulum dunhuangense]|uniref:YIP1 family protein n=1 Tax=Halovulum dunhuangense TaxID=1505036 RepID=A0A849L3K4_9RHOB|nr:Yip1 family protein [Halovulum dunhuangense]NNU80741.1 YIP1 family protein [Halovulum dunhuangense]
MTLPDLRQLVAESLTQPRSAARRILGVPIEPRVAVSVAALAIIAGTLMGALSRVLLPGVGNALSESLLGAPLVATALQFLFYFFTAWLVTALGRAMGGQGNLIDGLKLIAWLQVVMAVIQAVQIVVALILPFIAGLIGMASLIWFFWALAAFTAELHGFRRTSLVLVMIFISLFGLAMVLGIVLALLGVQLPETI